MKKILYLLTILVTTSCLAQLPPARFPDGIDSNFIQLDTLTTTQRDALTIPADRTRFIYNKTNNQLEWYDLSTLTWKPFGGGVGDMTKAVYDPTGVNADAFDYNNFYNTPTIPTMASQIGFTPYLTISSIDGQAAVQELKDELDTAVLDVASLKLEEDLTAVGGETSWVLTNTPSTGYIPQLYIGGILQRNGIDYSISGNTVSFLGINNPLVAGDEVHIEYNDVSAPTFSFAASDITNTPSGNLSG